MVNLGRGRKVCGGNFGFVEKGERLDEVKLSASSGSDEGEKVSPSEGISSLVC